MEEGENEAIAREECLVQRIENGNREIVGFSENERMVKVQM
jgi:hypothetical protein